MKSRWIKLMRQKDKQSTSLNIKGGEEGICSNIFLILTVNEYIL